MDYIVCVNDDIEFVSMMWIMFLILEFMWGMFVNIGVVGFIVSGFLNVNGNILIYDMVYRIYMDIFNGEYYLECFENVWIDDWIMFVYGYRLWVIWEWWVYYYIDYYGIRYRT